MSIYNDFYENWQQQWQCIDMEVKTLLPLEFLVDKRLYLKISDYTVN